MTTQPATVWLGLAGEWVAEEEQVDQYATRAGGRPIYLGEQPCLTAEQLPCSVCGAALSLVMQAYAPLALPARQAPERTLLVFGCTREGCGRLPGSWRAWRCQAGAAGAAGAVAKGAAGGATGITAGISAGVSAAGSTGEATSSSTAPEKQEERAAFIAPAAPAAHTPAASAAATASAAAAFDDAWDTGGDWGAPSDTSATAAAFDFSDLTHALEQAAAAAAAVIQKKTAGPSQQQQQQQQRQRQKADSKTAQPAAAAGSAATQPCCTGDSGPLLPEFHLSAAEEPSGPAKGAANRKELQHVRELMQQYEVESHQQPQQAGAGTSTSSGGTDSRAAAAAAAGACATAGAGGTGTGAGAGDEGDEPSGGWAAEEYEREVIAGVVPGYTKFSKRLQRCPQQCARYCFNGPVLWPKPPAPDLQPCPACGAPRVFELQLMPALITMLLEAADMLPGEQQQQMQQVLASVADWDWCTVAVFTCSQSCRASDGGGVSCVEELVHIITEQDCHVGAASSPLPHLQRAAGGGGQQGHGPK